jgi:hypothetical protein
MKKTLIIALCCIAVTFAACKKPVEPTPEDTVDYTTNYVGNYIGSYNFAITSMNNQASSLTFQIDNIGMNITKGTAFNAIAATVTVDNETRQTTGKALKDKADFETVHLIIDKPDQGYRFELDLKMEGTKESDNLNITGTFSGNGTFTFNGVENILNEVSGNLSGNLVKQ